MKEPHVNIIHDRLTGRAYQRPNIVEEAYLGKPPNPIEAEYLSRVRRVSAMERALRPSLWQRITRWFRG